MGSNRGGKTYRVIAGEIVWTDTRTLDEARAERIAGIKELARSRILAIVPEWRQTNLIARGVELADRGRAAWTADELAEWNAGQAIWDAVKAIRAASDVAEAAVLAAATNEAVDAVAW